MNGELFPGPAKNVQILGEWYKPRKKLFRNATPMDYKGKRVPGIKIKEKDFGSIGNSYKRDNLIHLINFKGKLLNMVLTFNKERWESIEKVILEPMDINIPFETKGNKISIFISKEHIDPADTIIRIKKA